MPTTSTAASVIRDYYLNKFRQDLHKFMPRADSPVFGGEWNGDCLVLERIAVERRAHFLVCLYFTVLVDQAFYNHSDCYPQFEALTRYPKFWQGLSRNRNPRDILDVPFDSGLVSSEAIAEIAPAGMELFVDEVVSFASEHLAEFEADVFFEKLISDPDVFIPLLVVELNPTLKNAPAWIVFEALRAAVWKKFPHLASR